VEKTDCKKKFIKSMKTFSLHSYQLISRYI